MYVNWLHYSIPKISFVLSFISNPVFIYLICSNKKVLFGSYRYLLVFFAVFNLCASVADLLIPVSVFCYRYAFVTWIVEGPFSEIVTGLNIKSITMSKQTTQMQKQLFKALAIQTIIPICVSFMPCSLSFYGAALRIDFMNWVYWASAVAVSMFPFLDPMAIIFFLPALRRRIMNPIGLGRTSVSVVTHQYSEASNHT
ncbi:unnamed protein product [Caenorhabditis nigoni]